MVGRTVLFNTRKPEKTIGEPVLEVKDLTVVDDHVEKVKNVSLSIRKGEIVGVAGVAGAGQSQLVECLFGLRKASSGRIFYQGKDITRLLPRGHRTRKIGYVPEDRLGTGTSREASITDNAIMGYHVAHRFSVPFLVNRKEAETFADQIIADYQVKADSNRTLIENLSGGNVQKVVVGREFLQQNHLLIVEDPTRGIDVGAIEFIWQKIIDIAAQGVSILLISHELTEVMELSDRILVMYDGKVVGDLPNIPELDEQTVGLYMLGGKTDEA